MTWVKLDDGFWSNRKVRAAWRREPASVGLHVMALAWAAGHLTDGFVDDDLLDLCFAGRPGREEAVAALIDVGLWHEQNGGWQINDYLEFNPSAEQVAAQREAKRLAGRLGGKRSGESRRGE